MATVRTSPRNFAVAGGLLGLFNALMLGLSIAGTPTNELPSPDRALQMLVLHTAAFIGLLVVGHALLKRQQMSRRFHYALLGGAAAATAYTFALHQGLMIQLPLEGTRITAGILPTILGMIAGTLYIHFAGYEVKDETVADEAGPKEGQNRTAIASAPSSAFDGPIQVRNSVAATALAALIPAASAGIACLFFFGSFAATEGAASPERTSWSLEIMGVAVSGYLFMIVLVVTLIPSAIGIQVAHGIARALKLTDYLTYAAAGFFISLTMTLILMSISMIPVFGALTAASGALMGAAYRKLAGIEPLALPEVVLATDRRALVDADHPMRRTHTVIINN